MMYDSGVKSLVIGRGQCRWKNIKFGYPYLISTEKFIHWMPADDLRIGSYTPGDQVSKGLCPYAKHQSWSILPTALPQSSPAHVIVSTQQDKQEGKLKNRRPEQAGLLRLPSPCRLCRGSDLAHSLHITDLIPLPCRRRVLERRLGRH